MLVRSAPNICFSKNNSWVITGDGCAVPLSSDELKRVSLLRLQEDTILPEDIPLLQAGVLVPVDVAKKTLETSRERWKAYLRDRAGLIIMPTERCNFRCTYCYETFLKGRMSDELQDRLVKLLENRVPCFPLFSLSWFGGEPLLAPDIIVRLTSKYRDLQAKHGFRGSVSVTTNGFNTKALHEIESCQVDLFQISLDGPRKVHNKDRVLANGRPTYDIILDNIEYLLAKTSSNVILRANIDSTDKAFALLTAKWFEKEIIPRFTKFGSRITFKAIARWEATTTSVEGICIRTLEEYENWNIVAKAIGKGSIAEMINKPGSLACYAGLPNVHIVGSDGTLYKCSVAFDLPENQIGHVGNEGQLIIDPIKEDLWTQKNALSDPTCGSCAFATSCIGLHCPLVRLQSGNPPCPTEKVYLNSKDLKSEFLEVQ